MISDFEKPIGNVSVVNTVIERLTNAILSGDFRAGQKIPTEMELSRMWNVGRNSVREAIKCLVYIGALEIRRSEGTFVADHYSDSMLNPLLYSLMLQCDTPQSLIELRRLIDVGTLDLAIEKASPEDVRAIKEAKDRIAEMIYDSNATIEQIMECDIHFHRLLSAACHSSALDRINTVVTHLTIPSRRETVKFFLEKQYKDFMAEAHEKIYSVLEQRDHSQILSATNFHYTYWEHNVLKK